MREFDAAQRLKAVQCLLLASFLSWGCAEILGLDEPHPRPTKQTGGTSGQSTGGSSGTVAGEGGMAGAEQGGTAGGGSGTGGSGTGGTGDQGGTAGDTGGGGTGGSDGCVVGNKRCGGETSKTPEVCDDERNWVVNDAENGGAACPILCDVGVCTECRDTDRRCGGVQGKVPQHCDGGAWQNEPVCEHFCRNAACEFPPSCRLLPNCSETTSCCSAMEVPGGTFIRDYDSVNYTNQNFRATLSSFILDEFEVTVGRLRKFVEAYPNLELREGDGQAEHIEGDGWQSQYPLPATVDELKAQLNCNRSTFSEGGTNQELPANCVNFFVAYAFCIWDGGRLPTEAEWNYAAAGGAEQRVYPWSDTAGSLAITQDHVAFDRTDPLPLAVGSKPLGNGLWGHADLAGSLDEWTLDFYSEPYQLAQCNDCLVQTASGLRSIRGGSFDDPASYLFVSKRLNLGEHAPRYYLGFRCVRDI